MLAASMIRSPGNRPARAAGVSSIGSADGVSSAARFYQPSGVATDAAGNVYVADTSNHTIRKITATGVVTTLAGAVGSQTPLVSLTTNAGGTTTINGGSVTTTGDQLYGDAVTLGGDTSLSTGSGAGNIGFGSTLNAATTGVDLALTADAGDVTFTGPDDGGFGLTARSWITSRA